MKKSGLKLVSAMVCLLGFSVTATELVDPKAMVAEAKASTSQLALEKFTLKMASEGVVVVDVRTKEEYDAGHIPGAVSLSRGKLEFFIDDHAQQDTTILLYCRTGSRSALANQTLTQMGYQNVFDLDGGYKAWSAANKADN